MYRTEWNEERIDRITNEDPLAFGVSFLDDALIGLRRNDLLIIGAKTGRGKTALGTQLAQNMAKAGANVAFYALEADRWEIHRRMLYRKMGQIFFEKLASAARGIEFPRYVEWLSKPGGEWEPLEKAAAEELQIDTVSLRIIYHGAKFSAGQFAKEISSLKADETDVVIIDHLHYFDFETRTEVDGIKQAVHVVRNSALFHSVPVILLAHLRKTDRKTEKSNPHLEDFHGHSDIVKVATQVLLLSPVPSEGRAPTPNFQTYFHIAKSRTAAEVTPYVAIHEFDLSRNQYSESYTLCRERAFEDPVSLTWNEIPKWAKRARKSMGVR